MKKKIAIRLLMTFTVSLFLQACSTHQHAAHQYNRGRNKSMFLLYKGGPGFKWVNKHERYSPID